MVRKNEGLKKFSEIRRSSADSKGVKQNRDLMEQAEQENWSDEKYAERSEETVAIRSDIEPQVKK